MERREQNALVGTPAPQDIARRDMARTTRMGQEQPPIGKKEIRKAWDVFMKYRSGKEYLDERIRDDDRWWRLKHMERREKEEFGQEYPSAWLFSSVMQKHAYAMENYPEDNVLPRAKDDVEEAKRLSSIIPVIKENNDFRETYSQIAWRKMQSGTGVYGVFWDSDALNGLGDIVVRPINVLNLFWQPGVNDIQRSRYLFHVEWVYRADLEEQFPGIRISASTTRGATKEYAHEDQVDRSEQVEVVDWYYHRRNGKTKALHLCKFTGDTVLYSSENEGLPYWYEDPSYPFVFDVLFPMEDSPAGFGYIDVGRYAQKQIDLINQGVMTNTLMRARPRYFEATNGAINRDQFRDWREQIVEVAGSLNENVLKGIDVPNLDGNILNFMNIKIAELKETTSNQDVQTGTTSGGVTAASAIQALQQSAGMPSKDATRTSHRANERVTSMIIERIRQFYELPRQFRITGERGQQEYIEYRNNDLRPQPQPGMGGEDMGMRKPLFDVKVSSENENQYTKLTNNETVKDLFGMGLFNPQNSPIASVVLEFMDLPDKDKLLDAIRTNGTMQDRLMQYGQLAVALLGQAGREREAQQLAAQLAMDAGQEAPAPGSAPQRSAAERAVLGEMSGSEAKTRARTDAATTI